MASSSGISYTLALLVSACAAVGLSIPLSSSASEPVSVKEFSFKTAVKKSSAEVVEDSPRDEPRKSPTDTQQTARPQSDSTGSAKSVSGLYPLPRIASSGKRTPVPERTIVLDGRPGDREEIGLFTEWQSEFLATGRNRELVIAQADSMLGVPWCDFANMKLPTWKGGKYGISFAHMPNLFFVPYLLTGDPRYVQPMECLYQILQEWTARSLNETPGPALGLDGKRPMFWLTGRDYAWSLRNLAQLAYIELRGGTQQKIYVQALENTRQAALARMQGSIEREFHVLGENQLGGMNQWSGWFEGFIGMTVNHAINLGFEEWRDVAQWHFAHLEWRCGGKWPVKACDIDHVSVAADGTWGNTPPYNAERMACYDAAPPDQLMPIKCGDVFMTYDDRAQIARSWAAMAAANRINGAAELYAKLDGLVDERGVETWYKYALLPEPGARASSAADSASRLRGATQEVSSEQEMSLGQRLTAGSPIATDPQLPPAGESRRIQPKAAPDSPLLDLPAGTWLEIPGTRIKDVLPAQSFQQPIRYIVGPAALITTWNGAVFNQQLQRLDIFSSGGHADYCGNEYLGFSLNTLDWQLVHGPSDLTGFDLKSGTVEGQNPPSMGFAPDGKPISRHTYAGQVYHPGLNRSFMFGGSLCSGAGTADDRWWSVTPDGDYTLLGGKGAWTTLGNAAEYDPVSNNIWLTDSGNIIEYDVASNRKIRRTNNGSNGRWGQMSAIDPSRRLLFVFGHFSPGDSVSGAYTFHLDTGVMKPVSLTGDLTIIERPGVGLEYVPELDVYAAWIEGQTLYLIDPDTFHITAYQTRGTPPAQASPNGVYGRFAYSAVYGGFVVVTSIDSNVFFLKLPPG